MLGCKFVQMRDIHLDAISNVVDSSLFLVAVLKVMILLFVNHAYCMDHLSYDFVMAPLG